MSLNSAAQTWRNLSAFGGAPLPEWAQFMLELGRSAGRSVSSDPQLVTWRIITVPQRNFAAGLFALGFLEASIDRVLSTIDAIDLTKLDEGQKITWRKTSGTIAFGKYVGFSPAGDGSPEETIRYQQGGLIVRRTLSGARKWNLAPYYGEDFVHDRAMSRNIDFFREYFPNRHEDLLCNTVHTLCVIGRPALWEDLRAQELAVNGIAGCLDDLLRVSGDNENATEDVSHYLTTFVSPDRDELNEVSVDCAVFDSSRAYPKLKNFVTAKQNLVVLDRWENSATDSANAFAADYSHAGADIKQSAAGLKVPETIEYVEWSKSKR